MKNEILEDTNTQVEEQPFEVVVRYAWGNERHKTWFITKTSRAFLPRGSRRLYTLVCEKTTEPICSIETYPRVGDIVSDIDGERLKIIEIK